MDAIDSRIGAKLAHQEECRACEARVTMATTAKSTKLSGFVTSGHDAGLCDIAFTPDGASVLTCGGEGQVLAWNAVATHGATAAQTSSIMDDAAGITCMAVDSTRSQLVTGSFEGNDVKAWDLGGWSLVKCLTSCAGHVNGVAVSASGDMMCVRRRIVQCRVLCSAVQYIATRDVCRVCCGGVVVVMAWRFLLRVAVCLVLWPSRSRAYCCVHCCAHCLAFACSL